MIYPLKSKPDRSLSKKIYTAIFIFIFFALVQYFFHSSLQGYTQIISKPVWSTTGFITKPFSVIINFFINKNSLINENKILKDEITRLNLKVFDYDNIQKENDNLKNLLGKNDKSQKILANVISKPPQSPYDTYIVDVGESSGIEKGDKVYLSDKIIVGDVLEVGPKTSLIELFSTQGKNTTVILDRTGNTFVIFGLGGGNYKLEVPKDTDLLWGDVFLYPGKNAVIGNVNYIDTNSQSAFKTVYIRSPINIFTYKNLLIEE